MSAQRPAWVLLAAEGAARGFKSTLAFRRFCRRSGIPINPVGKLQFVRPSDVDAVLEGKREPSGDADVNHALQQLKRGA